MAKHNKVSLNTKQDASTNRTDRVKGLKAEVDIRSWHLIRTSEARRNSPKRDKELSTTIALKNSMLCKENIITDFAVLYSSFSPKHNS